MKLDAAQKRIIRSKVLGYNLVRGAAGSGKTIVAVNRSVYLKDNYCLYETDKILMIAQNDSHLQYIKEILNKTEEESQIELITLFSNQRDKVKLETIDSIIYSYFLKYKRNYRFNGELISNNDKQNIIIECIKEINKSYKAVKILDHKYVNFFIDEINWIKDCNYVELNAYQNADRVGRKVKKGEGPQRLLKNSKVREAIFTIMLLYNDILSEKKLIDSRDMTLLAIKYAKEDKEKYTHIIVDDSQSLTKIQLDFLDLLCSKKIYSNIMLIINRDQHLNGNGWIIKGRKFSNLNLDENIKKYSLTKNYVNNGRVDEQKKDVVKLEVESVENLLKQRESEISYLEGREEPIDRSLIYGEIEIKDAVKVEEKYSIEGTSGMSKKVSAFIESFEYCDLRHNRKFQFIRDLNNISEIIVKNEDKEEIYTSGELRELAIYSDIAAGEPILINPDIEGDFFIPHYWLKGIKDCFILKVKGDSMIGANIEDGDCVVIRKQYTAQNNDIIAVDLDGSATLKRLQIGKGRIVLMPENEKYNPIIVTDNEVNVIGVAVGVVKEKN